MGSPGFFENIWYGWWRPEIWRENQLRLEVFPVIYQVFVTQDFFHPPYDWENQVTKNSSKRMGTGEFATFFVVTFTFGFYKLTWWQHKSPIPTKHLHMHKTFGIWYLNLPYFGLSYYPHWIRWSKKSPTGPTKRTPKKPEYLIARSQLTWGPLGFGPIQFCLDMGYLEKKRNKRALVWAEQKLLDASGGEWVLITFGRQNFPFFCHRIDG